MGVNFTNFHRTYIQGFVAVGFKIERVIEPTISKGQLARYPELDDELRALNFIV